MKPKFIKLFTIVLTMSMAFVGCSNDDDKVPGAKDIQKEYAAEDVAVKYGEKVVKGATVKVNAVDDKNIVVTLNNVVAGFATIDVDAAVVTTTKTVEYAFAGEKTVGEMKISIAGTIVDGKVAINVTNKITSSIVGEWTSYLTNEGFKTIQFVYTNEANKSTYRLVSDGKTVTKTNAEFCANIQDFITIIELFAIQKIKITLTEDGFISASATLMGEKVVAEKAMRYSYDSEKKLLYIALPAEVGAILGRDLPLACEIKEGVLCADIQYATLKPLISILQTLDTEGAITKIVVDLIKDSMPESFADYTKTATNLVEDIFTALKDKTTTNVELDLKMSAVKPAPVV